ncbi:MAG: molecular chaperone HtpG, partial [Myxococcales bacterium]|nr:molecular chaperone HtpG [Myxococcales bacterium]
MAEATSNEQTQHAFQAEVSRVLSLVINSLYSNKEVFLRELVSNAADALDKLRFKALTDKSLLQGDTELKVRIIPDKEAGTLTIWDNGIGMTEAELVENLGTVAHSGSAAFLEQLAERKGDVELIGQFGVGFYSAYLVADEVEVISLAAGETKAVRWASKGQDGFVTGPAERETRGTSIVLHLKESHREYLELWTLRSLVSRYSDFVSYPIELPTFTAAGDEDEEKAEEAPAFEQVNQASALWRRPESEVSEEQYKEFYSHISHDWEAPLTRTHFTIEGTQQFTGLLYIPSRPPFDLFASGQSRGLRLHVKRVFVMDECEDLLPPWLRFLRGVVDSDDLPLNVSRETLQDSRVIKVIRKQVVKKALDMIEALAVDNPDGFETFWTHFGAVLKEGFHYDPEHKNRLAKLLRFKTSKGEGLVSLDQYVNRMPVAQPAIYFVQGLNAERLAKSP